jgi:ribosomal protein L11 methyltransferase
LADAPALEVTFLAAPARRGLHASAQRGEAAASEAGGEVGAHPFLRERLYALLDDFEPVAIHEDDSGETWRVFFRSPDQRDAASAHLAAAVAPHLLHLSPIDVPDEDWARRSQQKLTAIEVEGLVIAPPWDVQRGAATPVIIIEPSMGFGTGHHATTRLCLRLLQRRELRGARVIDVGTGSGVLALAAWKLGARDVVAIDNDPDALANARANIARNGAAAAIDTICDDLNRVRLQPADIVLANLTAGVLVRHAEVLKKLARPEGHLILSGFAPDHQMTIGPAFEGRMFEEIREGDWAALCLHPPPAAQR